MYANTDIQAFYFVIATTKIELSDKICCLIRIIFNLHLHVIAFLQVAIGVALMIFVVQRARKELASALQHSNKAILPVFIQSLFFLIASFGKSI